MEDYKGFLYKEVERLKVYPTSNVGNIFIDLDNVIYSEDETICYGRLTPFHEVEFIVEGDDPNNPLGEINSIMEADWDRTEANLSLRKNVEVIAARAFLRR